MRPRGLHYAVVFVLMISASCGADPELEGETPAETLGNVSAEEGRQELESPETEEIDLTAAAAAPVANTGERESARAAGPESPSNQEDERADSVRNLDNCRQMRERPATMYTGAGPLQLLRVGTEVYSAGYLRQRGQDEVVVMRIRRNGTVRSVTRGSLGSSGARGATAPPALIQEPGSNRLLVLAVDGTARLLRASIGLDAQPGSLSFEQVATGVDSRFSPALIAREEAIMAAWTKSGTPMKLAFTPSLTESPMRTIEVFPVGGSSCHPRFVENEDGIDLYSVDARAGVSVLHRTSIRANATTGETEVVRPLMNLANPPQFEITDAGGESHIAYSAIGSMASSAVGLVSLSPGGRLQPLFSGRGYGWVFVSGASEGGRGVFALVKPDGAGREDPRKLVIRQYDGERLGAEMEIVSGQRRAQHVSISHFEDDDFAVVYTAGATAEAAVFRCVD